MLEKLTIQNIALIDRAEIEFSRGLNVLSGETGAGKSIILDSIDFVLGAKADKSMIRYGEEFCLVRALFSVGENLRLREVFEEMDLEWEDCILISRKFTLDGKSQIKVNGCNVTATMLRKITAYLVDVHGQSEHFYLLRESNQLRLLDEIGGDTVREEKEKVARALAKRREILSSLKMLGGDESERERRLDVLRFQIDEIERADLKEGEEEELRGKRDKILNAERILDGLNTAISCLNADGSGMDAILSAQRALSSIERYEPQGGIFSERLEEVLSELSDVKESLQDLMDETSLDEEEAERIEARLDEIKTVKKKYGGNVSSVLDFLSRAKEEYDVLSDSGERYVRLTGELSVLERELYSACCRLTKVRKETAKSFTSRVTSELKTLNIASAQFDIAFAPYEESDVPRATGDGLDAVKFLFSANAGEPMKELGKIISGGEMSRFMLAIKAQLSSVNEIGTYLFDEIDAGISGITAKVVAEKFARISLSTQIIAVSHLAQIAAMADSHILIEKKQEGGKTYTRLTPLGEEGRKGEIVRLIGGDLGSDAAFVHANEMLKTSNEYKNSLH
ncbi:MAG: DNA repair protein RecN [Clostridia bacterium]|nr:DNA repair protein RecN [Clostridia bacterium]